MSVGNANAPRDGCSASMGGGLDWRMRGKGELAPRPAGSRDLEEGLALLGGSPDSRPGAWRGAGWAAFVGFDLLDHRHSATDLTGQVVLGRGRARRQSADPVAEGIRPSIPPPFCVYATHYLVAVRPFVSMFVSVTVTRQTDGCGVLLL